MLDVTEHDTYFIQSQVDIIVSCGDENLATLFLDKSFIYKIVIVSRSQKIILSTVLLLILLIHSLI